LSERTLLELEPGVIDADRELPGGIGRVELRASGG